MAAQARRRRTQACTRPPESLECQPCACLSVPRGDDLPEDPLCAGTGQTLSVIHSVGAWLGTGDADMVRQLGLRASRVTHKPLVISRGHWLCLQTTVVPPDLWSCFLCFQFPTVSVVQKSGDPPPDVWSEGQPDARSHVPVTPLLHLLHGHFIISHHCKKGECGAVRHSERERDHIPTTFITVHCYTRSSFLVVIVG